ncbi:MAG: hypothetical protein ACTHK2_06040 [Dokdonella sp.]|uniref:hypothetical protein n=1 Tax=Dokdonella sp. TaxID=2291710 RepID=UPI003F7F8ABF
MLRRFIAAFAMLLAAAGSAHAQSHRVTYTDPYSYFTTDAQFEAWYSLRARLAVDFDDICGDTFCEGDFSNITPLRFQCSVQRGSGRIGGCVWSFAASNEDIDPATGALDVQQPSWQCPIPIAPHTTIEALLSALAGDDPLDTPLPGTPLTVYDGLLHCL